MTPPNKRALVILSVWVIGVLLYLGGTKVAGIRREHLLMKGMLGSLEARQKNLEQALSIVRKDRMESQSKFTNLGQVLSEDQLRLKGQTAILEIAEKSGLRGARLRIESTEAMGEMMEFRWVLEGEGSFPQWVDVMDALGRLQPFMTIEGIRLELIGDPWSPNDKTTPDGPPVKGTVRCLWLVLAPSK